MLLGWAARYLDVRCCYAITYEDNICSKKALGKLNFKPVALKVANSYDEIDEQLYEQEYVYYRGDKKMDSTLLFELNHFFVNVGSELRVKSLASS